MFFVQPLGKKQKRGESQRIVFCTVTLVFGVNKTKTMGELITRKNGVEKRYLLNLAISPEITEEIVNDIINAHEIDNWEIVSGWSI